MEPQSGAISRCSKMATMDSDAEQGPDLSADDTVTVTVRDYDTVTACPKLVMTYDEVMALMSL
jgi:hypothetical protein